MKQWAEYKVRHQSFAERALVSIYPSSIPLPYSRGNYITNKLRQLHRFVEGAKQTAPDRYLSWCSIGNTGYVSRLLRNHTQADEYTFKAYGRYIQGGDDLNDVLLSDMKLVLPGDMLVKVDLMSMANSLEVRVPFLDYRVVDFAFTLPSIYKVDRRYRKKIVQDAFKSLLPDELYNRPKKGFEMPLLEWMRGGLFERMNKQWLNKELIEHQQIFNFNAIQELIRQLKSANPGDSPAKLWAIIQFQNFWLRYF
jgi:asparagine synthase (glutamine-hydrolysing)